MSIILYISNELYHYEELHRKQMHLTSIKSQIEDLINFLPSHLTLKKTFKKNQPYKHQIDSLNNELNKLKINYDILLIFNALLFLSSSLKEKAHNKCMRSFMELSNNHDILIKVWSIQPKDLTQITQLNHHKGEAYRIIAISNNRLASATEDRMVKI